MNLSLMVAAVLTFLSRQVPGVQELTRLLAREDLLWCRATKVAQQSLSERFLVFPAELFERAFKDLLPRLQLNCQQRIKRPLPDAESNQGFKSLRIISNLVASNQCGSETRIVLQFFYLKNRFLSVLCERLLIILVVKR